MTNALNELLKVLEYHGKLPQDIKAIRISFAEDCQFKTTAKGIELTPAIMKHLDREYDDGHGSQQLDGIVLLNDNTWLSRGEYSGSEWWEYNAPPTIEDILGKDI